MKKNQGFSLIELLVILGLIGILAVVAMGFFGRGPIQKSKFTSAMNNFIADFNFAKHVASRENRYVLIDFADSGQSYSIKTQTTLGDYTNWTPIDQKANVFPLEGLEFFNGATQPDIAVNSMGEVFTLPLAANAQPTAVTLTFYIKHITSGTIDYSKTINIRPYGGIK